MRVALRTAVFYSATSSVSFSRSLPRNPLLPPLLPFSSLLRSFSDSSGSLPPMVMTTTNAAATAAAGGVDGDGGGCGGGQGPSIPFSSSMETQFEYFRDQLEESGNVRELIRSVASEIEAVLRVMHADLLLVHQSIPPPEVLKKANAQIGVLRGHYGRLAEILRECPGQYYRYHSDWRSETQTAVSLLAFSHWLGTGSLLTHAEAENKLGLDASEFGLDIEDYLTGLCFMSNELPRYVVNQVTAGDYDCPRNLLKFLTELHSAFRMLNLRNDFLRKKFDGMKYDLRRVEEVYYDVKIRGLAPTESNPEPIA
ncbi:translin [Phalaenopsis equestris]|uniref:Translin-like protein n=1 Tax=Phalaenopsis equestris TaxID=78828 RepID=A0A1S6YG36_PHAEQ|nr:translin [Phalaenopsis equestris]AQX44226.1 translin-like protein [Phalaenopsis equestris]